MSAHDTDLMRRIELERADAARAALEEGITRISNLDGNEIYQRAWRRALEALRAQLARVR